MEDGWVGWMGEVWMGGWMEGWMGGWGKYEWVGGCKDDYYSLFWRQCTHTGTPNKG